MKNEFRDVIDGDRLLTVRKDQKKKCGVLKTTVHDLFTDPSFKYESCLCTVGSLKNTENLEKRVELS